MTFNRIIYLIYLLLLMLATKNTIYATDNSIEDDVCNFSTIALIEQQKIKEIKSTLTRAPYQHDVEEKADYLYAELTSAVREKQMATVEYLLFLNFNIYHGLISNYALDCIIGISALRGTQEDLAIIQNIFNKKKQKIATSMPIGPSVDQRQEYINEMSHLANKALTFAAGSGSRSIVTYVLENYDDLHLSVNGVDWALQNAMKHSHYEVRDLIISDLYQLSPIKPSLQGTISAIEISFENMDITSYKNDWLRILILDVLHNKNTIENILGHTTLSTRSLLVIKLLDQMQGEGSAQCLVPDQKSMVLAWLKFNESGQKTSAIKIRLAIGTVTLETVQSACSDLICHVFQLITEEQNTSWEPYHRYISQKYFFLDNLPPLLLEMATNKQLQLTPDVKAKLKKTCDILLVKSAQFGDYEMGLGLLDEKYQIAYDLNTIFLAIKSMDEALPAQKRTQKAREAKNTQYTPECLSSYENFTQLLMGRMF